MYANLGIFSPSDFQHKHCKGILEKGACCRVRHTAGRKRKRKLLKSKNLNVNILYSPF